MCQLLSMPQSSRFYPCLRLKTPTQGRYTVITTTKNTKLLFLAATLAFGWSSASYAGCTGSQVSGIWKTFASNGTECQIRINNRGELITSSSWCRNISAGIGKTPPNSGFVNVSGNCSGTGVITLLGTRNELDIQFSTIRGVATGIFYVPRTGETGNYAMIRMP